jgi:colicin import membrane protein
VDESPEEPALAPPSNNTFQAAQDPQTQNIDNSCSANNSAAIKPDPVIRSLMYGVAALIAVVILIVVASYRNSARYYLVAGDNAVEIWQGQFSPTGKHFFGVLHNYQLAEPAKSHYSKQDIFPVIFNYYLEKADALLETQNPPDFRSITEYLTDAKAYALNGKMAAAISSRLNTIERMTLLYKADVAIAQGTKASLDAAADYISRARATTTDAVQLQILDDKLAEIDVLRNALPAVDAKSEPKAESGSKETTDTEPSSSSSGGGAVE